MLGFLIRFCKDFDDPYILKSIYCSLVRPRLEYASVVWNPFYACHSRRLESVQRRFVLYALRKLGWRDRFNLPPYEDRLKLIDLDRLDLRRELSEATFTFDLLSGNIDSQKLLEKLDFNAPNLFNPRHFVLLRPSLQRSNYSLNKPIQRIVKAFNRLGHDFDFGMSRVGFRGRCRHNYEQPVVLYSS